MLALAEQLDSLVAELSAVQGPTDGLINALQRDSQPTTGAGENSEAGTSKTEAVLARLYPIELSILATPARTTADLGVKARHAAYVVSEYWEAPVEQLDWDARTIRLLIEAICSFTGTRLPFSEVTSDGYRRSSATHALGGALDSET
ncbi:MULTISPECIES: hypothetical protein [unclassified Bradyrhizobium]|uniref:hypothetical protein n=1 Tax=unclassified Bradyrhizobium TaxID=2631580 RepID=UPI0028EDCA60|nr:MULTISPECIES: hypothetical protein [unclassified Bradyrhizobium]